MTLYPKVLCVRSGGGRYEVDRYPNCDGSWSIVFRQDVPDTLLVQTGPGREPYYEPAGVQEIVVEGIPADALESAEAMTAYLCDERRMGGGWEVVMVEGCFALVPATDKEPS